jgi:SAM-dependent methyltransferase
MYVAAAAILLAGCGIYIVVPLPGLGHGLLLAALGLATSWPILSLLVSHYVYDRSALYGGEWLLPTLGQSPLRYATLHVGLDEFSAILQSRFPQSEASVIDFFDAQEMTEPSILRARREHAVALKSAILADFRALPFRDEELDAAFLIFAAHELREADSRRRLFQELRRTLKPKGQILLVEHLRDWSNFLAFGPGFLHFHSRAEWLRATSGANLSFAKEFAFTPFVRVFLLEKSA